MDDEFEDFVLSPEKIVNDLKEKVATTPPEDDDDVLKSAFSNTRYTKSQRVIQDWTNGAFPDSAPPFPPTLLIGHDDNIRSLVETVRAQTLRTTKRHLHLTTSPPPPPPPASRERFIRFDAIEHEFYRRECEQSEEAQNLCALINNVPTDLITVEQWVERAGSLSSGARELFTRPASTRKYHLQLAVNVGIYQVYFAVLVFLMDDDGGGGGGGEEGHFLIDDHVNMYGYIEDDVKRAATVNMDLIKENAEKARRQRELLKKPCKAEQLLGVQFYTCSCDFFSSSAS